MYRTGFCGTNKHEGTRPKSPSGKPMKVCVAYEICECECHDLYNRMHEMSGTPRIKYDNPEYVTPTPAFWMPTLENMAEARAATSAQSLGAPKKVKDANTSRGAALGVLERNVRSACEDWIKTSPDEMCTTRYVSEYIMEHFEINSGSGAIREVFLRWDKQGYAYIAQDPLRFIGLTIDGMKLGLEEIRLRTVAAAARRG